MSTIYNRRRGAKADSMRKPRLCRRAECPRLAQGNRYCSDHQLGEARAEV